MDQISTTNHQVRNVLTGTFILLFITAMVWYRISSNRDNVKNEIQQELRNTGYSAGATIVKEVSFSDGFTQRGEVKAGRTIVLNAEIDGKIVYSAIENGKEVIKGDVLAEIDKSTRLSSLAISSDTYQKSKDDYEKLKILLASGNASGMELENAKLLMQNAASQLKICKKQLGQTLVLAPETGTIIDKKANQGEYVSPGSLLGLMACMDKVLVNIFVPEGEVTSIRKGAVVHVHADAYPGITFEGKITAIIPVASAAKTFPIEIQIANSKSQKLLSGMAVSVSLNSDKKSSALVIPRTALIGDKDQVAVYVIRHSTLPVKTPVVTGNSYGEDLVVSKGLKAGDTVMTSGMLNVEPGKKIQWLTIRK